MRRLVSVSILVLSMALLTSVHAEDRFRVMMDAPIFYGLGSDDDGGAPDPGGNSPIEFLVNGSTGTTRADGRDLGNLNIAVSVTGIGTDYTVNVVGLPDGATWNGTAIVWPAAVSGTYSPAIEVRDGENNLVASQQMELVVHPNLTATVPQEAYEVDVGETLVITPSVANLIADGAVQWGATLPGWMDLDADDGKVTVNTAAVQSADNIILTAVDQTDLKQASTQPFSVTVNGVCGAWTARPAPEQNNWISVTYGNGMFVAVANTGTVNRIMTSSDGVNWTAQAAPEQNNWVSVTYGGGQFVAVANAGTANRIMTSPDGMNWTAQAAPEQNGWISVAYGNGMFVAVANAGTVNRIMTSLDGANWTAQAAPERNGWRSVTYGNGMFVAVATDGSNRIMTSLDGVNWMAQAAPEQNTWVSVTYGKGKFVASAADGTANRIMTSPDGVNWTAQVTPEQNYWFSVTYGNGQFVAVANLGTNRIMTSSDGVAWTARATPEQNAWFSVTYGNGMFVAVATEGANRIMTSDCN